jgi:hypothetical protein
MTMNGVVKDRGAGYKFKLNETVMKNYEKQSDDF